MSAEPQPGEHEFAGRVSIACHDLRTPLATVFGFARTLERQGGLDERQGRYVSMVVAAAQEMMRLIDDLAVLARIESGSFVPRTEDVELRAVAVEAAAEVTGRFEGTREVHGPGDGASTSVRTDRKLFGAALANLVEGALRLEPRRPALTLDLTPEGDVELGPIEPETARQLERDADDLRVVAARMLLAELGARIAVRGERLSVSFAT